MAGHDDGCRATLLHHLGIQSPVPHRSCPFGFVLTLAKPPMLRALIRGRCESAPLPDDEAWASGRLSPRGRVILANEEAPIWAAYRMPAGRQVWNGGLSPSIRAGLMQCEAPFGLRSCFRRSVRTPILSSGSVRAPRSVRNLFLDPGSVRAPRSVRTPFLSPRPLGDPCSVIWELGAPRAFSDRGDLWSPLRTAFMRPHEDRLSHQPL